MHNSKLLTVFLIVFVDLFGFGIIIPLLPAYAESFGAAAWVIGVLLATYSTMQLIGAPLLGRLSDRYGRRPLLLLSQAGTFGGFVLLALANSLPLLFVARILDGFTGGNLSIAQAVIADVVEEKDRARAYGLIGAAFGLGFILGPATGGILSRWGFAAPAWAAAVVSLVSISLTFFLLPETRQPGRRYSADARREFSASALRRALDNPALIRLLSLGLIFNVGFAIFQTTFALFAQDQFGFDVEATGYMLGYVGVLIVISQVLVLPRMVNRLGERGTILAGALTLGLGLFFTGLLNTWPPLLGAMILVAIGGAVVNPSLRSLYTQTVSEDEVGGVLGLSASVDSLSRILAPLWGGWVLGLLGAHAPSLSAALVLFVAAGFAVWALGLRHPAPQAK